MNVSPLGFSSSVTSGMVVGLSVVVSEVVVVAVVVVGVVVVAGVVVVVDVVVVVVVRVVLVVGLLVVVVVVVNRSLPCERERSDATTVRSTSHQDQRQLCKALVGICNLASHSLS